ncbi:site-specific DNA-methyltransferase [Oceanimonas sp. NS1]|nr:site-specific DNA-methyltransferase [Oceanimonas sp. NS1]
MDKLKMHSPDMSQQNIDKIRALFPNCVTESHTPDGSLRLAVDFDLLKQELSDSIVEGPQERYHLNWPGKRQALLTANAPIAKTLRPCREDSVNFDTTQNLFIEGDNLDALKLLQETYLGKVKLIYIDPPYNTGHDFLYEDDFAEDADEFLIKSNQKDDQGNRLVANPETNGRFHSDWLSSLYKRVKISKRLLSNDGVLAISIDDNEIANLTHILDEEFGWGNRKIICVKMSESSGLKMGSVKRNGTIPKLKEYLVLCSPNGINGIKLDGIPKETWDSEYNIFLDGISRQDRETISNAINQENSKISIEELDSIGERITLKSVSSVFSETGLPEEKKTEWLFENSWRICQCATSSSVLKLVKEKSRECSQDVFFVRSATGIIYPVRSTINQNSKNLESN